VYIVDAHLIQQLVCHNCNTNCFRTAKMSSCGCVPLSPELVVTPCGAWGAVQDLLLDYSFLLNGDSSPTDGDWYCISVRLAGIRWHVEYHVTCPEVKRIVADVVVMGGLREIDEILCSMGIR